MNMRFLTLLCACITVAGCAGAPRRSAEGAQFHTLEGPAPYSWDCKVEGGKFDQVLIPGVAEHLRVTGIVHVVTMHPDATWGSAATVGFQGKEAQRGGVAFQMIVWPGQPFSRQLILRGDGGSKETTVLATHVNKESDTPFAITLSKGLVTVSVAGRTTTSYHPQADMNRAILSCSGAHVRFLHVVATVLP